MNAVNRPCTQNGTIIAAQLSTIACTFSKSLVLKENGEESSKICSLDLELLADLLKSKSNNLRIFLREIFINQIYLCGYASIHNTLKSKNCA